METKTYIMNSRQFEDEEAFAQALEVISPYRRQKIALLRHENDKNRSLAAALTLNAGLRNFALEERMMEYDVGPQGKPQLRYYPEIRFSLSHSGDYAICSIGEEEIGNDIEWVREGKERVAERFFAKEECAWIQNAASPEEKNERLFRIWTIKESFLKVTGLGMSLPLNAFTVTIENDGEISLCHQLNSKTYYIKEYTLPKPCTYYETIDYKIALCSESPSFALEPEVVSLP
ncbi:MAG: 4'-phosphopantetheinyl transferase superfamily protein [Roseburia sp.]|nr:4'-phosphopantetheinyl transferase superfamily protein [Roseburia sp.]